MKTFILNDYWDIEAKNNNIYMTDTSKNDKKQGISYAIAQKVANNIRLFKNDAYYAQNEGIRHFDIELKTNANLNLLRKIIQEEALKVAEVTAASIDYLAIENRQLTGEIFLELENGEKIYVDI